MPPPVPVAGAPSAGGPSMPSLPPREPPSHLSWDEYFMYIALMSAARAKDPSTQVGCCITNGEKRVIGIGYNGFPRIGASYNPVWFVRPWLWMAEGLVFPVWKWAEDLAGERRTDGRACCGGGSSGSSTATSSSCKRCMIDLLYPAVVCEEVSVSCPVATTSSLKRRASIDMNTDGAAEFIDGVKDERYRPTETSTNDRSGVPVDQAPAPPLVPTNGNDGREAPSARAPVASDNEAVEPAAGASKFLTAAGGVAAVVDKSEEASKPADAGEDLSPSGGGSGQVGVGDSKAKNRRVRKKKKRGASASPDAVTPLAMTPSDFNGTTSKDLSLFQPRDEDGGGAPSVADASTKTGSGSTSASSSKAPSHGGGPNGDAKIRSSPLSERLSPFRLVRATVRPFVRPCVRVIKTVLKNLFAVHANSGLLMRSPLFLRYLRFLGLWDNDVAFPWGRDGSGGVSQSKYAYVVHAEVVSTFHDPSKAMALLQANAILNKTAAIDERCVLYTSLYPCNECAKLVVQCGIREVVYLSDKHHTTESAQAARKLFELAGVRAREFVPRDFAKDTSPILEAVRDTVLTDPDRSSSAAISFCTSIRPVLSTFSWVVVGAACHHFSDRERGKVTLERMGRGVFESKVGGLLESVLRRVGGSSLRGVGLTRGTGR